MKHHPPSPTSMLFDHFSWIHVVNGLPHDKDGNIVRGVEGEGVANSCFNDFGQDYSAVSVTNYNSSVSRC